MCVFDLALTRYLLISLRPWRRAIPVVCWLFAALLPMSRCLSATELATVQVGGADFQVEVVQREDERRRGLMFRQTLPADQGMLFVQPPGRAEFWMKNTLIPLDLLYFDIDGTLLEIVPAVPPCRVRNCPIYPSASAAVRYILEIKAGEAARRRIAVGASLLLDR
ncbi:DUF192 domain-containing protein [Lamprocystis purpurea]|jgi:hypothetical protein|uniref:DUF192 domain-containing protein n=1 Tax=Lamprocystis purpurea TaxID=61598 RepID=UPI000361AF12|nr:DUF192 domain-containing protein [Lamprocystis purpurea]